MVQNTGIRYPSIANPTDHVKYLERPGFGESEPRARAGRIMSSSRSDTEDPLCRGDDACYICGGSKSYHWGTVEVRREDASSDVTLVTLE
ncbi:hypothetical protein TNCV_2139591 [Trichonephila clavipes]|uniref:Uncharacterized protein n=1 Tax=Trichonephila clavipes TaxID=2585209 RepID=A0A8X6V125_TRICX|nr:hypothetical protein TNCV_2139591 [Trichonephila clavipes]